MEDIVGQAVVHFEIEGRAAATLREFYSTLFGWRIDLIPNNPAEYGLISTDSNSDGNNDGGGIGGHQPGSRLALGHVDLDEHRHMPRIPSSRFGPSRRRSRPATRGKPGRQAHARSRPAPARH
jgi:hypothetical protein